MAARLVYKETDNITRFLHGPYRPDFGSAKRCFFFEILFPEFQAWGAAGWASCQL
jgi:hypothetical protein